MIRCFACLIAIFCAPLSPSAPALAQYGGPERAILEVRTPDKAILDVICHPGQIRMRECLKARDYPEGRECNVRLTSERIEGRFLGGETRYLLAFYRSRCEPYAHQFGGGLILEKSGDALIFQGYRPGLVLSGCVTVAKNGRGDRLVCTGAWTDQSGYDMQILGEVVFKKEKTGVIATAIEELLLAVRTESARGADALECDRTSVYFSFAHVAHGPAPETVAFSTVYADQPLIDRLCDRLAQNVRPGLAPLMENEAYIPRGEAKTGRFLYDLTKRAILPLEAPPMR